MNAHFIWGREMGAKIRDPSIRPHRTDPHFRTPLYLGFESFEKVVFIRLVTEKIRFERRYRH